MQKVKVKSKSFVQYLLDKKIITESQLLEAVKIQKKEGIKLGSSLIKLGYIDEDRLFNLLSEFYGYPLINILTINKDPNVVKLIPYEIMKQYKVVPFEKSGNTIKIAVCDPLSVVINRIRFLLPEFNLEIYLTKYSHMLQYLR